LNDNENLLTGGARPDFVAPEGTIPKPLVV